MARRLELDELVPSKWNHSMIPAIRYPCFFTTPLWCTRIFCYIKFLLQIHSSKSISCLLSFSLHLVRDSSFPTCKWSLSSAFPRYSREVSWTRGTREGIKQPLSLLPYDLLLSYLPEQQWIEKGLFGYWGQNFALNEIPYDQDQKGIQLKESTPLKL